MTLKILNEKLLYEVKFLGMIVSNYNVTFIWTLLLSKVIHIYVDVNYMKLDTNIQRTSTIFLYFQVFPWVCLVEG